MCCAGPTGGLLYLETALRYGINTVTVVNNNHSLNQEKRSNERIYGGQTSGSDELWHLLDVDFGKVAQSIGCFGIRVEESGQIQSALEQAFASGKPAVVDVATDIDGIAPLAWSP
jgi:acetolactate synthase-1/2/3 large subunit